MKKYRAALCALLAALMLTCCGKTDNADSTASGGAAGTESSAAAESRQGVEAAGDYDCVGVLTSGNDPLSEGDGEYLRLKDDGTGTMSFSMNENDEFKVTWRYENRKLIVTDPGDEKSESYSGTYKDGIIKLDVEGFIMVLARNGSEEWKAWNADKEQFGKDFMEGKYFDANPAAETEPVKDTTADTGTEPESSAADTSETESAGGAGEDSKDPSDSSEVTAPDGTGGHAEDELYKLYGWWRSSENEDYIHIWDGSFEASVNGVSANGDLEYADKDGNDCFILAANSADFPADTFVYRDKDKPGRMTYVNNGVTTDYIDRGDFDVKFVRAEKDAIGYDGEPLSFPITIELTAKEDVTDLTLLKLDNYEFDTVHGFSYSFTDQLTIPKLERGKTFVPTVDIPETIPAFGIRYRDIHGVTHYYDISISGKDGSVLLTSFFEKG